MNSSDCPSAHPTHVALVCICLTLALSIGGCAHKSASDGGPAAERDSTTMLASWMEGAFNSQAQSQADPEYFDIRLHMKRIWTGRKDGPWLYIEQARSDFLDKPYRQRVYRVTKLTDKTYRSDVYTLPEPLGRFVGAGSDEVKTVAVFAGLKPEDLKLLDGCGVVLRWNPSAQAFAGGTEDTGCAGTREGAKYTSSEITFTPGLLTSWDRGFDAEGNQVWGAKKGGYQFVKE